MDICFPGIMTKKCPQEVWKNKMDIRSQNKTNPFSKRIGSSEYKADLCPFIEYPKRTEFSEKKKDQAFASK